MIGLNRKTIHPNCNAIHMDHFAIHMGFSPIWCEKRGIVQEFGGRAELIVFSL